METVSGPPTVAEIDLGALGANYRALKAAGHGAQLMAVVKADAYGHGAIEVARALRGEGCGHFGVARVCEARELRAAGVRERIYLMGGFLAGEAEEIVGLDLTPFVFDAALIAPLGRAVEARARANFQVHLKIDSGATRLGILPGELDQAIEELGRAPSLTVEGVCTLLANAGDPQSPVTDRAARSVQRRGGATAGGRDRRAGRPRRQLGRLRAAPRRALQPDAPRARASTDCRRCRPCASGSNCGP